MIINLTISRASIFVFCLVLVFDIGYAQKVNNRLKADINLFHDELFAQPHWEFIIAPNITGKAILTHNETSQYKLQTSPQISGEIGVARSFHFDKHRSIGLGMILGMAGRNASFIVPDSLLGYPGGGLYVINRGFAREYDIQYFSFPLYFEQRIRLRSCNSLFFRGGANLKIVFSGGSGSGVDNILDLSIDGNRKPIINFNAGGGYLFVLKNKNLLKLGLNYNWDPRWLAKGFYDFKTLVSRDYGSYTVKGSSIGLAISYVLTRFNKLRPLQGLGQGN
jgi:hypothetical protein